MLLGEVHQLGTKMKSKAKNNRKRLINFLDLFNSLPTSTQSVLKRTTAAILLLTCFAIAIYAGPVVIIISVMGLQIKCFSEVISIAYRNYDPGDIFRFKYISYHLLACSLWYFWGENVLEHFTPLTDKYKLLQTLSTYHRFASFCFYFFGMILFVLNLKKRYYRRQFSLLAWNHVVLLVIVTQSCLVTRVIFQGMIWFIICVTAITSNDIMAYVCGKLFGRTPLIALSPKKTWEGFIGAGIFSVIITCAMTYSLVDNPFFVCPIEYREINGAISQVTQCQPDEIFQLRSYSLLVIGSSLKLYPIVLHSFWLAIFGSVVAPFGGFFASGFKRAFNVKDFGDVIPGHGGLMDRFDCQLVMITFVNVYISSFIGSGGHGNDGIEPGRLLGKILELSIGDQVKLFGLLGKALTDKGIVL